MKFRTEINIDPAPLNIKHTDKTITMGSCFAENIGEYFSKYKFNVMKNPFGVLYNPVSILNAIVCLKEKKLFSRDDLIYEQSEWHSFYFHSDFSSHDADVCLKNINTKIHETSDFLSKASVIIITLGTSFVFRHKEKNIIVSNCHKIPPQQFEHFMLNQEETLNNLQAIVGTLKKINKNIGVIFTVSPIRHWKNGAVNNQLSKANLIVAVHETLKKNNNVFYFPSYEIMMDDLRDYRYYSEDLIHLNSVAVDYIWEKFRGTFFTNRTNILITQLDKIIRAAGHRPRNIASVQHQNFIKHALTELENLLSENPFLNLDDLRGIFEEQIVDKGK